MARQSTTPSKRAQRRNASKRAVKERSRRAAEPLGAAPTPPAASWLSRHGPILFVVTMMVLVALVRVRLSAAPLERDEGEYAYAGQLILRGVPPYELVYNMKFPGTYYAYALILALFGESARGIHLGLLVVDAATTFLLFLLGRRLIGAFGASIAAAAFSVLSVDRGTLGVYAHATHFVILPATAGFLVLLRACESKRAGWFIAAGVLLGTAVMMTQQAIFFVPLGLAFAVWIEMRAQPRRLTVGLERSALVAFGAAIPFVLVCSVLAMQGVLGRFWYWTFDYARQYVSEIPLSSAWRLFLVGLYNVTRADKALWILGACGVALVWLVRWTTVARVFLTALLVASVLAISPGFYFRNHYFVLLLPATALFVGAAIASGRRLLERVLPASAAGAIAASIFALVVLGYVASEEDYLLLIPARDISKRIYGANPFVEALDIARYIRERTAPDDRIAVLGSEPEIYFYANRKSATGYIYTYPLMEDQPYARQMRSEMIRQVESTHPKYVVFVSIPTSWLEQNSQPDFFNWADRYAHACYDLVGVADVYSNRESTLVWDARATSYKPQSNLLVYTLRRRSDAPCAA